jgi:hypothetical protein
MRRGLLALVGLLFATACGGSKPAPATQDTPAASASTASPATAAASGAASAAPSASEEDDETSPSVKAAVAAASSSAPSPSATPGAAIALENLLGKAAPGASKDFPKATTTDKDCVGAINLSGKSDKDYDAVISKCGAPTGLKEFTRKVTGKLDASHKRDTYSFSMLGGYCYRFFAVGDATIANLDVRIQRPGGALVSMDQSSQPVAIIDPDRTWCKTHDRQFSLVVETTSGSGSYAFGIWARPK